MRFALTHAPAHTIRLQFVETLAVSFAVMAPWLKFLIPLPFLAMGLLAMMVLPFWLGAIAALVLMVIGAVIASAVFKRIATPDEIKADLEARLHND